MDILRERMLRTVGIGLCLVSFMLTLVFFGHTPFALVWCVAMMLAAIWLARW